MAWTNWIIINKTEMKKFNLTDVTRTRLCILLVTLIMSSCGGKDTVYFWNMKDIVGFWFYGIIVVGFILIVSYYWVADKIDEWKRSR